MIDKPKEKRKGRPASHHQLSLLVMVCLILVGLLYLSNRIAQQFVEPFSLVTFDIAEERNQIALSWWNGTTGLVATRKWHDVQKNGGVTNLLGTSNYDYVAYIDVHPSHEGLVTLSSKGWLQIHQSSYGVIRLPQYRKALYTQEEIVLLDDRLAVYSLPFTSQDAQFEYAVNNRDSDITNFAMSPDGKMLAVIENTSSGVKMLEIINISNSTTTQSFSLLAGEAYSIAFHPKGTEVAVSINHALFRLNLVTGYKAYFPVGMNFQLAYDSSGRWLAAIRNEPNSNADISYVYDLSSETKIPRRYPLAGNAQALKGQFVKDGLVIGNKHNQLILWQWNGEAWLKTDTWLVTQ